MSFNAAEIAFLSQGSFAHPELLFSPKTQLADVAVLRAHYGDKSRAVAELLKARRSNKFPLHWLADAESAQQATPPQVATWRAQYLRSLGVSRAFDVTCSIGTEGRAVTEAGLDYAGSDLDFSRLLMARHNLPELPFIQANALAPGFRLTDSDVVIADPARRAGGRRITDPAKLLPPLPDLMAAFAEKDLAIKCAPGLDFSDWPGQVVLVSLDGAVKEACLFSPGLARGRRAVMLSSTATGHRSPGVEVVDSTEPDSCAVAEPGRFIIDPDGAVVRAGLVRHYAAKYGLWQLDEHLAYLSGPKLPQGVSGFEFIEKVAIKKLKSALLAHGCGALEILVRGVNVDPDVLRKKLKLRGSRPMSVVIARVGNGAVAYICGPRVSSSKD